MGQQTHMKWRPEGGGGLHDLRGSSSRFPSRWFCRPLSCSVWFRKEELCSLLVDFASPLIPMCQEVWEFRKQVADGICHIFPRRDHSGARRGRPLFPFRVWPRTAIAYSRQGSIARCYACADIIRLFFITAFLFLNQSQSFREIIWNLRHGPWCLPWVSME